jgi:hypothetical protein
MRTYHNSGHTLTDSVAAEPPKHFRLCARWTDHSVKLEQNVRTRKFRVTYGLQVNDDLTYAQACDYLGRAFLHDLACNGVLDNSEGV